MALVCWTRTAAPNDRALATKPAPAPAGTVTSTVLEGTSTPQLAPTGAFAASRAALTRSSPARLRVTSFGVAPGDLVSRSAVAAGSAAAVPAAAPDGATSSPATASSRPSTSSRTRPAGRDGSNGDIAAPPGCRRDGGTRAGGHVPSRSLTGGPGWASRDDSTQTVRLRKGL